MPRWTAVRGTVYGLEAAMIVLATSYGVRPFRLIDSGFGELVVSVAVVSLPAGMGFSLQTGETHRLTGLASFPLLLLCLGWQLVLGFQSYARDIRRTRLSLLRRIGWERAVPLHDFLLLSGYGVLLLAPAAGISVGIVWPAFLGMPFGVLVMLLLRGIVSGARPNWPLLTAASAASVGLTAYFLSLSFWLR
jgi:1,4-dihydroxy-2-naphthoate octaprenyltransferase